MLKVLWDLWPPVPCWCLSLSCPHLSLYPSIILTDFAPKPIGIHGAIFPPELPKFRISVSPLALLPSLTFCSQLADKLCWIFLPPSSLFALSSPALASALVPTRPSRSPVARDCHNSLLLTPRNHPCRFSFFQWHLVIFPSYKASIQQLLIDDAIIRQPLWRYQGYKATVTSEKRQVCNQWQHSRSKGVTAVTGEWAGTGTGKLGEIIYSFLPSSLSPTLALPVSLSNSFIHSFICSFIQKTLSSDKPDRYIWQDVRGLWKWMWYGVTP